MAKVLRVKCDHPLHVNVTDQMLKLSASHDLARVMTSSTTRPSFSENMNGLFSRRCFGANRLSLGLCLDPGRHTPACLVLGPPPNQPL